MDDYRWLEFQKSLTNLTNAFYHLSPDNKPRAVNVTRECLGHMQSALKHQLCSDGMRTVAAMAETMIQETYGIGGPDKNVMLNGSYHDNSILMSPILQNGSSQLFLDYTIGLPSGNKDLSVPESDDTMNLLFRYEAMQNSSVSEFNSIFPDFALVANNSNNANGVLDDQIAGTSNSNTTTSTLLDLDQPAQRFQIPMETSANNTVTPAANNVLVSPNLTSQNAIIETPSFQTIVPNLAPPSTIDNSSVPVLKKNYFTTQKIDDLIVFKCSLCFTTTKYRQNIHRHVQNHLAEMKAASSSPNIVSNVKTDPGIPDKNNTVEKGVTSLLRPFECRDCHKSFKTKSALNEHRQYLHVIVKRVEGDVLVSAQPNLKTLEPLNVMKNNDNKMPTIAPIFNNQIIELNIAKQKEKIEPVVVENSVNVDDPENAIKGSFSSEKLKELLDTAKPFACGKCDKRFAISKGLFRHMHETHSERRPHICTCGAAFKNSYHLKRHTGRSCHIVKSVSLPSSLN